MRFNIRLKLYYIRLKILLHRFYSAEMWSKWDLVSADNEEYLRKHKKECDDILKSIPLEYRLEFMRFLGMKAVYLQRKGGSRVGGADKIWIDARLSQSLTEHRQIKTFNELERLQREQEELAKIK